MLEIRGLRIELDGVRAVDEVSLTVEEGETVCLVGESGCGKSLTALSLGRLLDTPPARYVGGEIRVLGRDVLKMSASELRGIRGGVVGYVFQEAGASLNPLIRVGAQIRETLRLHQPELAAEAEVIRQLAQVGIPAPERRCRDYPHQLSGGMQQRVMIALALASRPRLLVADEPTTALDVTLQAQVLDLLRDRQRQCRMGILFITHNFGVVAEMADRVAVMYAGEIVESGPAREVLRRPRHPYTRALIGSVPRLGADADRLVSIPGQVPRLGMWPAGCRFHPRCDRVRDSCRRDEPGWYDVGPESPGTRVRCPYANE